MFSELYTGLMDLSNSSPLGGCNGYRKHIREGDLYKMKAIYQHPHSDERSIRLLEGAFLAAALRHTGDEKTLIEIFNQHNPYNPNDYWVKLHDRCRYDAITETYQSFLEHGHAYFKIEE